MEENTELNVTNKTGTDHYYTDDENTDSEYRRMIMIYCYLYGGSINLVILTSAVSVLVCCNRLRSARTTIHINLLASFLLRFTAEGIFVAGVHAGYVFEELVFEVIHYIFKYVFVAPFTWMLVEGLYLHFILVLRPFQDSKPPFLLFYFIGWGVPALTTITWALCLFFDDNSRSLYAGDKFEYIITAPMVIGLVINLIIVVNLIRIILTKLSSNNSTEAKKIWQVSKSMMILMFLLGPIHLVFAYPMSSDKNAVVSIIYRVYNIIAPHVQAVVCAIYTVTTGKVSQAFTRRWSRFKDLQTIKSLTLSKRSSNAHVSTQVNVSLVIDESV